MPPDLSSNPIYLDYQATTPSDPRVFDAMRPFFEGVFGNPHSAAHLYGWQASDAVETARQMIARSIGAKTHEIIFTSGATEANNLAVKGAALWRREKEGRNHVLVLKTEHPCVLQSCQALKRYGIEVIELDVQKDGLVDCNLVEKWADANTSLICAMLAHNEIGVIQPIQKLSKIARNVGAWLHCDAAQALGKIPLNVDQIGADLLSLSGHKTYGPKGIGALYLRTRPYRVNIMPLIDGGGQEKGLRAGTLPVALCVGFGKAAEIAFAEQEKEASRLLKMRDSLWEKLQASIPNIILNGSLSKRLPGNLNISIPDIASDDLIANLPQLAVSSASACSGHKEDSYVLKAIGHNPAKEMATLRLGFGRFSTDDQISRAADMIAEAVLVLARNKKID